MVRLLRIAQQSPGHRHYHLLLAGPAAHRMPCRCQQQRAAAAAASSMLRGLLQPAARLCSRRASASMQPPPAAAAAAAHTAASPAAAAAREAKAALRKAIKQQLRQLTPHDMQQQSAAIAQRVIACPLFRAASSIGLYITCERLREVDTSAILAAALQAGKDVYVPLVEDSSSNMSLLQIGGLEDLQPAPPFGILEPSRARPDGSARQQVLDAPGGLDLLVMPGLGFDDRGRRLGRGGGYYDKLVHQLDERAQQQGRQPPWLLALAFAQQLVEAVPMDEHDRHVDVVATAQQLLRCSERAASECVVTK